MFKYIVVGAGFSGLTMAERIARQVKEHVLVIEKRNHIGGNCYDEYNPEGLLTHKYGPHIFHTNSQKVWEYVNRFTEWIYYQHRVMAYIDGAYVPLPISIETVNRLYNVNLSCMEFEDFIRKRSLSFPVIDNAEKMALNLVGRDLYEKIYKNYTFKQWGLNPSELDKSVVERLPIRYNRDSRYFNDRYQGIPKLGYHNLFQKMLDSPYIHVLLNTDFKQILASLDYEYLIYTGPIDYFFDYKYGTLKYRSLKFESDIFDREIVQAAPVINYPNDFDFTRATEYKQMTQQVHPKTVVVREYPTWDGEPCYPVPQPECLKQYQLYEKETQSLENVLFVGRLAEYKYSNMDAIIDNALEIFKTRILKDQTDTD
ncbi:MAG TPA: UDP-galactopyranose mutase [Bacillota bacterium]|nr:UDP-galactopyranose mutase [Bacillota bacterium]